MATNREDPGKDQGESGRGRFTPEARRLFLRFLFPGVLQGLLLLTVGRGAISALGHDADQVLVSTLLTVVILLIVFNTIAYTQTWQESVRLTLAYAVIGGAVWIVASLV